MPDGEEAPWIVELNQQLFLPSPVDTELAHRLWWDLTRVRQISPALNEGDVLGMDHSSPRPRFTGMTKLVLWKRSTMRLIFACPRGTATVFKSNEQTRRGAEKQMLLVHGAKQHATVQIDAYNAELRDREGYVGRSCQ